MKLNPLFRMQITLGKRYPIGPVPKGRRSVLALEDGIVSGPKINGKIMPVGGEFELIDAEGVYHVNVRLVIQTDDLANIYVQYFGVAQLNPAAISKIQNQQTIDFGETYFVTQPRFETSHEKYAWLNNVMAVAEGRSTKDGVDYLVYACEPDASVGLAKVDEVFK